MPDPIQQVDAFLGPGSYLEWQEFERDWDTQVKRYENVQRLLHLPFTSRLYDRSDSDLYQLGDIATTYRQGINLIISNQPPVEKKMRRMRELYIQAIALAEYDDDILEALWASGFAAAWITFPFLLLQAKSNLMLEALKELRKQLAEAEHELRNAHKKQAFHLAVTFFEAMFPELSLTSRAAIYLADVAVDKVLGPSDPTTVQRYTGDVTPGVKQLSEAVHHIHAYSETARDVAEKTGKVATVVTFYFDFKEIGEGEEMVEKLEDLVEKVKLAYDDLQKVLDQHLPALQRFLFAYDNMVRRIDEVANDRDEARRNLSELTRAYQYAGASNTTWLTYP